MEKSLRLLLVLIFMGTLFTLEPASKLYPKAEEKGCCQEKTVKCPVSGKVIAKDAMTVSTEYQGKTYYFCCEDCKAEFQKNPEKYVKETACSTHYTCSHSGCEFKSDKPRICTTQGMELKKHECTPVFVCPMKEHNIKSDKPGKCPQCGMELKKSACDCTCSHKNESKPEREENNQ